MMNSCAPVVIPTLCRYKHFRSCIESLAENSLAVQTPLYIALDFPLKEEHWAGYLEIKEYVSTIVGFSEVNIILREKNYGVRNAISAIDTVLEKYDSFIFSEDDNVFSKNFLAYINKGLELYKDNNQIYSISGYNYPINLSKKDNDYNIYYMKGYSAWGCGLWRDKFQNHRKESDLRYCQKIFSSLKSLIKITKVSNHYFLALLDIIDTGNVTDDTVVCIKSILNETYSVFPILSKVRNIGNDGSGMHCGELVDDIFSSQEIDQDSDFNFNYPDGIAHNSYIMKHFKDYFDCKWGIILKALLKFCLRRIFTRKTSLSKH